MPERESSETEPESRLRQQVRFLKRAARHLREQPERYRGQIEVMLRATRMAVSLLEQLERGEEIDVAVLDEFNGGLLRLHDPLEALRLVKPDQAYPLEFVTEFLRVATVIMVWAMERTDRRGDTRRIRRPEPEPPPPSA